MNLKFNKDKCKLICDDYIKGYNLSLLSLKHKVSIRHVYRILRLNRVKIKKELIEHFRRKYNLNDNYFSSIDSEDKSYFLGLFFADGYNNERKHSVRLLLKDSDIDILLEFKKYINSESPIHSCISNKIYKQCYIDICSKNISSDISKLGCTQKKSLTLKYPNITDYNLNRHFIRGYFDGDGCIYLKYRINKIKQKSPVCVVSVCSTESFLESLNNIISKDIGILGKKIKCGNVYNLWIGGNKKAIKFLDWIYNDSSIYIERKHYKYIQFKKDYETSLSR